MTDSISNSTSGVSCWC